MMDFYNQNKSDMLPFFDREKRLESQNADSVMEGDVEYLNADGKKVFSIFMEGEESDNNNKADVGIILLHTRGSHPNEEKTIKPLRINLAEHGYNTLSVQMPVLEKSAKYYDYVPILSTLTLELKQQLIFIKKWVLRKLYL
jgi:hypothetical protein